jgi:hypothetical protein
MPMALPVLLLPILASVVGAPTAAPAPTRPANDIVVTGHAWAPFISPMGEPFRAHSPTDDTLADWFAKADRNHDGSLTVDEMQADADRFFALLDTDHNGEIDPDEVANYEWEVAPDIQVMSRIKRAPGQPAPKARQSDTDSDRPKDERRRGDEEYAMLGLGGALQGAARYALLNIPEPVAAADTNFDREIILGEFRQAAVARIELLDSQHSGSLTLEQLQALRPVTSTADRRRKRVKDAADTRVGNPLPADH